MNDINKLVIIIPSLNPDEKLLNLIEDLDKNSIKNIVIVNDGSEKDTLFIFDKIKEKYNIPVLNHSINLGKGRSLKTAFNYILDNFKDSIGVITVDSDGQHRIKDIMAVASKMLKSQKTDKLILGARDFKNSNVPARSKFGNITTRNIFKILCGISVTDTQTGLRGIYKEYMIELMNVQGERFEFEMNMLIETKTKHIKIEEVPIETVYIEENKTSHFNPLVDSIKIYSLFMKFIIASGLSFVIDIWIFSVVVGLLKINAPTYYIILATIIARVISSIFNFIVNRKMVFKSEEKGNSELIKYYTLCIIQMLTSALLVDILFGLIHINETIVKIMVDAILFVISFQIQREFIFNKRRK